MSSLRYALVTPARNEAKLIGRTLRSVVAQTALPLRWVIVSDGSTDGTDRIVQEYVERHPWIELVRLREREGRSAAGKARAFAAGYQRLRDVPYDVVGNLDADVSFDEEYCRFLLERFADMPDLGVAGTPFREGTAQYDYRFTNIEHVSGACQLFRGECFDDVGGYLPVEEGGIDWIAVTTARMRGWQTRTFVEKVCVHHRPIGSAVRGGWQVWFHRGARDYALGGHPLWQVFRSAYQSTSRPYAIGGLMLLCGYTYRMMHGAKRPVSDELMRFHRAEQMHRLKRTAVRVMTSVTRRDGDEAGGGVPLDESLAGLERWVEEHDYKGYEPFDGLSSPLRRLAFGNQFLERILQQVGRQSPLNLRPLLGITPRESTKGRGFMARGYLASLQRTADPVYRTKARACLEWLIRNRSPRASHYSWGNHFDYASRAGRYAEQEPIIVWTSLIGQAFLDAYECLGEARYLDVARGVCEWILALPRERSPSGACLSYFAARQLSIHNANLLGAAMLARTARHTGRAELIEVARAALEYSCTRQQPDGAWYYGEEPRYRWIDNFHTAYNLDSLKCYADSTGDQTFRHHLERGFRYFRNTFVEPDGRPRYYHDRAYPIDIQCAAQTIETLANFADRERGALRAAVKVAGWTIGNMRDPSGFFHYRRYPLFAARIPMLHWGQATMYRALALLSLQLERGSAHTHIASP